MKLSWMGSTLAAGLTIVLASACQGIADIPDVRFDEFCTSYCDLVETNCPAALAPYETRRECLKACAILDENAQFSRQTIGNTMGCRLEQARQAGALTGLIEKAPACAAAGPGGGDICTIHDQLPDCEGYCALYTRACAGDFQRSVVTQKDVVGTELDCINKCAAVQPTPNETYSWQQGKASGDTLGCRLYYATRSLEDPATNCESAGLRPVGACLGDPQQPPPCANFCRAVKVACAGNLQVYDNDEADTQCEAVCAATPPGKKTDLGSQDTVGCRTSHAYNALLVNASAHCPHIGPTGSNVCGDMMLGNCGAYCRLAQKACGAQFDATFDGDMQTCVDACLGMQGADQKAYSVASAQSGNSVQCRAYHAAVALTRAVDKRECEPVFGGAPCQ